MRYIMTNFNHERLSIAVATTRQARVALSAAFEYVLKREAFGKPLIDQPVVRHRLAKAGALLESQWAWVEQFAYQLTQMKKEESDVALGGLMGLLKANAVCTPYTTRSPHTNLKIHNQTGELQKSC